jgi:hypothetical protein
LREPGGVVEREMYSSGSLSCTKDAMADETRISAVVRGKWRCVHVSCDNESVAKVSFVST